MILYKFNVKLVIGQALLERKATENMIKMALVHDVNFCYLL